MRVGIVRRSLAAGLFALALAVGAGGATPALAAEEPNVSVVLVPQADTASLTDGVDTYQIVVTNHGSVEAKRISVSLPFAAEYIPEGASFSRGRAWVARVGATNLDLQIEQLRGNGDSLSATLGFVSRGEAQANALQSRATVDWSGNDSQIGNVSNLPAARSAATIAPAQIDGRPAFSVLAAAFASDEPVSFWVTSAAGVSTPLVVKDGILLVEPTRAAWEEEEAYGTALAATSQGDFQALVSVVGLARGEYTLAGRGGWSGLVISAPITVR